ncbi:hypothetical protein [Lacrimispora xylanisolvens]|uniref:hypothetical protein n=1 Tax=Lacrimispora xylanisolvens TaxID=384636 RepID=UPI002402B855
MANSEFILGTLPPAYTPAFPIAKAYVNYAGGTEWIYYQLIIETSGIVRAYCSKTTNYIVPFELSFIIN